MIQYTLENTIILCVFQTLLAGLIFLVCAWESFQQPARPDRVPLAIAFFFFSGFVLLRSVFSIGLSLGGNLADLSWPFLLLSLLETVFLVCLLVWVAPSPSWRKAFLVALFLLPAAHLASRSILFPETPLTFEPSYHGGPLHFSLSLLLFLLARRAFPQRWNLIHAGLLLFAGSYLAESIFDFYLPRPLVPLWNLQHAAKILGLLSFALHLEKEGSHIYLQFFMRLNLIFMLAANVFMLILSETERRQYLDFSAAQVQDLAEFLRGHILYFYREGMTPRAIVEREEINHKIVSELGRISSLKQVKLEASPHQLLMAIGPDGSISYRVGEDLFPHHPESIYDYTQNTVTVLRIPVTAEGQSIGFLQFEEDLQVLGRMIAGRMQLIFSSFTIVVFVTLVALGFIVSKAQKTIRHQYQALQEKQEELIQASRLASIGELVDGVAHEVNNPTGVILIRSECALAALPSAPESARQDLEEIRLQATRMTKLVRNLLAFSRASAMKAVPVDLNEVVRRSLDLVWAYLKITGIRVELDLARGLLPVSGDADRLQQVAINLLKNAADAMPKGGVLSCTTWGDHDLVSLAVADTGTGIPPETLGQVFDPFFTTKAPGQGTGLGLSISYGIVRDHGGRIEVQSEPERGSVFTVHLPCLRR